MIITDAETGPKKLVEYLDTGEFKKVLLPCWHGIGDIVMFNAPLTYLRNKYPHIKIDVGLAAGLQEEILLTGVVNLEGSWKEDVLKMDYDLVFACHMPLEDASNVNQTKAEVCCIKELGIPPVSGHLPIPKKKIVGVHFHNTSVAFAANPPEEVCKKVWDEIIQAGMIPVETLFQHGFYNSNTSGKYGFTTNHVREWPARLDACVAVVGSCDYFIGAVSGNFHLALSLLPYDKVALLEKDLKVGHFTKMPVKGIDCKQYVEGSVREWLKTQECLIPTKFEAVKSVLIVEDMPDRREAFKKKFKDWDFTLTNNVIDAIDWLKKKTFDMVCLDHDLSYDPRTGNGVFLDHDSPFCGTRVAEYMRDNNYKGRVVIQSLNAGGAENMNNLLPQATRIPFYWDKEGI